MIDESSMYWLTRMDYFCTLLSGVGTVGIIACALSGIPFLLTSCDEKHTDVTKVTKRLALSFLTLGMLCLVGRAFVPTTKELAAIKVVPAIVNNETLKQECSEFYVLAKAWLKDSLGVKEGKPQAEATGK